MTEAFAIPAALAALGWLYLVLFHGRFWRADRRLGPAPDRARGPSGRWPAVAAVVPARDEAALVGGAVASLLAQDYPGPLTVVLVDDGSTDGTAEAARAAVPADRRHRFHVVEARPPAAGWTGKLSALAQGVAGAGAVAGDPPYLWFTDADVVHGPATLRRLVGKAEADGLDLVSLMVLLRCLSRWERLLIPAFVFFFRKLYPFPWVNDRRRGTAGAAGGCLLVRREALARAGGIAAIRGAVIDDCALARAVKAGGPIWLGLTAQSRSTRPYDGLAPIWTMVARTAYSQLGYSPLRLSLAVLGMVWLYQAPPAATLAGAALGAPVPALAGAAGWGLMTLAYWPTLRLYGRPAPAALLLPAAAFLYALMTLDSARRHRRGGAAWKGRHYRPPPPGPAGGRPDSTGADGRRSGNRAGNTTSAQISV